MIRVTNRRKGTCTACQEAGGEAKELTNHGRGAHVGIEIEEQSALRVVILCPHHARQLLTRLQKYIDNEFPVKPMQEEHDDARL